MYVGHCLLGFTEKEVGRMTLRTFNKFYKCYKDNFDLEMRLKLSNTTYEEAIKELGFTYLMKNRNRQE